MGTFSSEVSKSWEWFQLSQKVYFFSHNLYCYLSSEGIWLFVTINVWLNACRSALMFVSMLAVLFTDELELWAECSMWCSPRLLISVRLCSAFSPFVPWVPKGVTYRSFAGGCYKWKFSAHSISFVSWEKWCVCQEYSGEEVSIERPLLPPHTWDFPWTEFILVIFAVSAEWWWPGASVILNSRDSNSQDVPHINPAHRLTKEHFQCFQIVWHKENLLVYCIVETDPGAAIFRNMFIH